MSIVLRQRVFLSLILLTICFVPLTSAEISDESCSLNEPCPPGMECFSFPGVGLRCASPNPCSYFQCPEATSCAVALSYPGQVVCSQKANEAGSSCRTNEDCKAVIDYCNCQQRCVNKFTELENCSPRDCRFGYDTLVCTCENNKCVEGPRE